MIDKCACAWCPEEQVRDAIFCHRHLDDWYCRRLVRLSDGTFASTSGPRPRWLARQDEPEAEGNTMNALGRDETGWASRNAA